MRWLGATVFYRWLPVSRIRYWPTLLTKKRGLGVACVPIRRPGTGIPDEEARRCRQWPRRNYRNRWVMIGDQRNARDRIQTEVHYDEGLGMEVVIVRSMTVDEGALVDGGATIGDEEAIEEDEEDSNELVPTDLKTWSIRLSIHYPHQMDSAVDGGRVGPHKMGICTEGLLMALALAVQRTERWYLCGTDFAFRRSAKKERNRVIRVDHFPIFFEKNAKPRKRSTELGSGLAGNGLPEAASSEGTV
ncbi:hypothetical protein EDB92DRAFT_1818298 [Lactarius akahatsu]|uniref:Uncharacterized protein n=1 Tax=Lactarius akahatsu TaxID=416441 RepID=A0AAD4LB96_9AGAM|nr:hypothetical protein EDB92DRAFT_1818298 [Lactarius akahatsu]